MSKVDCVAFIRALGIPVTLKSLDMWRTAGKGPASIRHGKFVRFDPKAVRAWAFNEPPAFREVPMGPESAAVPPIKRGDKW